MKIRRGIRIAINHQSASDAVTDAVRKDFKPKKSNINNPLGMESMTRKTTVHILILILILGMESTEAQLQFTSL